MSHIVDSYLSPLCIDTRIVQVEPNRLAAVLRLSEGAVPKGISLVLMEILSVFNQQFSIKLSAAVSSVCDEVYALQDSYEEAVLLLNERFFEDNNSIFLNQTRSVENKKYDYKLENEIWCSIQENNFEKIKASVDRFIDEIRFLSYGYARLYIGQLIINILTFGISEFPEMDIQLIDIHKETMENLETISQAKEKILNLCRWVASHNSDTSNNDIIERTLCLIKNNYSNVSFSVNSVAEDIGLSIVYLNRIFRKNMGISFSSYLNNYRLNVACNLLSATNDSINHVCTMVGINNESYFYTLFKKKFGITPHQYRKKV